MTKKTSCSNCLGLGLLPPAGHSADDEPRVCSRCSGTGRATDARTLRTDATAFVVSMTDTKEAA